MVFRLNFLKPSIISIPKKGDLSDCNNYHGISFINVGLKIISKIVTNRIAKNALEHKFLRPEQFGFRNKEECISLYISTREICQRRKFQRNFTYLCFFLILKKAYDSVPIFNIFWPEINLYLSQMISFWSFAMIIEQKSLNVSLDSEKDYDNNVYYFILNMKKIKLNDNRTKDN